MMRKWHSESSVHEKSEEWYISAEKERKDDRFLQFHCQFSHKKICSWLVWSHNQFPVSVLFSFFVFHSSHGDHRLFLYDFKEFHVFWYAEGSSDCRFFVYPYFLFQSCHLFESPLIIFHENLCRSWRHILRWVIAFELL